MLLKLNLGCGDVVPAGWVNVDYALGARLLRFSPIRWLNRKFRFFRMDWDPTIRLVDLTEVLPWRSEEVDVIYSSHTLEHLSRERGYALLTECYRVLKPGGILRIVVPDLQCVINDYENGVVPADQFVESLGISLSGSKGLVGRLKRMWEYPHQCMYTTERLVEILADLGFQAAGASCYDSQIDGIEAIELDNRTERAVVVEAIKSS